MPEAPNAPPVVQLQLFTLDGSFIGRSDPPADSFRQGIGAPNVTYSKSALIRMDALASTGHIGLVYARNADGTDQIIEANVLCLSEATRPVAPAGARSSDRASFTPVASLPPPCS
jgi:hypothetical protein